MIITRIMWVLILGSVFLLPFLSPDVFVKSSHCLYATLSILLIIFAAAAKTYLKNRVMLFLLLIWLIIIGVTSIFAVYPYTALENALYFLFYGLVFISLAGLDHRRKRQIILVLISGSFLISLRAILQYHFYFEEVMPHIAARGMPFNEREFLYLSDIAARRRAISTFNTPNLLGSYLVIINFLIAGFIFSSKNRKIVAGLLLLLAINCYSLWLTRSIAAWASFIFGIFLFIILLPVQEAEVRKKMRRFAVGFLCCIVFLLAVLFIRRLYYVLGTDNILLSLEGRFQFWKAALAAITDRPLNFSGPGGFGYLYPLYAPPGELESRMAHNLFLQLWVETGIYGLVVFILFLGSVILAGIKDILKRKEADEKRVFQAVLLCAVSAFLFHNMAGFSFFVPQTAVIWWILCSLLAAPE